MIIFVGWFCYILNSYLLLVLISKESRKDKEFLLSLSLVNSVAGSTMFCVSVIPDISIFSKNLQS